MGLEGMLGGRFGIALSAAACVALAPAAASPWNRKDGGFFVSTTANYYWSEAPDGSYARIDSDTYLEFGLSGDWMTGGRVSYGTGISKSQAGRIVESGLNEAEIYLQRQIQRGAHSATSAKISAVRSGALSVDAQTGKPSPNFEIEIRALHGRDLILSPVKAFAAGEVGFRRRFGGDAGQVRADALIGIEPSSDWLVLLEAQSITSLRNEDPGFVDYDLYKGQVTVVWRKSRRWSVAAGARKELSARNISPGTAGFIGLWSEF